MSTTELVLNMLAETSTKIFLPLFILRDLKKAAELPAEAVK